MADRPRRPSDKNYRIRPVRRDVIDVDKFARGLLRLVEAQDAASQPVDVDHRKGVSDEAS